MSLTIEKALQNILYYKEVTVNNSIQLIQSLSKQELLTSFKIDLALRYYIAIQNENWLTRLKFVASHWSIGYAMTSNYFENELDVQESQTESIKDFLDLCITIGKENPKYWIKVSSSLNLIYTKIEPFIKRLHEKKFVITENEYQVVKHQYYF